MERTTGSQKSGMNLPRTFNAILIARLVALAITLLIFFAVFSGVRALFG
jgi:hypothetical protein